MLTVLSERTDLLVTLGADCDEIAADKKQLGARLQQLNSVLETLGAAQAEPDAFPVQTGERIFDTTIRDAVQNGRRIQVH